MARELLGSIQVGSAAVITSAAIYCFWRYFKSDKGGTGTAKATPAARVQAENSLLTTETPPNAKAPTKTVPDQSSVFIYFGSQSWTAEGFAAELEREAAARGLQAVVVDMENFSPEEFMQHKVVVLVVSTTGEGEPPDNAFEFFKWLEDDDLSGDVLSGIKFTVMGLGNRQYVNFNACGKAADKHLERLGAERIYHLGEGDADQNKTEKCFEEWKGGGLWPALQKAMGVGDQTLAGVAEIGMSLETVEEVQSKLQLRAVIADEKSAPIDLMVQGGGADVLGKWYFNASLAPILSNVELRQVRDVAAGKTTKHVEFDIKHLPALDWRTADNLEVLPSNPDEVVEWFAQRLGVQSQLDENMTFVRASGVDKAVRKPFPVPCLVRKALELYCDLCVAPARGAARRFAALATDPDDRAFLDGLLQDREAYQMLTGNGAHLTLREFFELFLPSVQVDFGTFLQLCPRQKSRPYTIASSSLENRKQIGICVSMVKDDLLLSLATIVENLAQRGHHLPDAATRLCNVAGKGVASRCFNGLCSTMLCTRSVKGDRLMIAVRPSIFRLPKMTTTPVIMVGAGTGIAPFRGFVREFHAEKGTRQKTVLFFGCTKSEEDYIYREELEDALKSQPPVLHELVTAFSREQQHKVYVQHRLKERAQDVARLIDEGAYLYVCGAVAMGKAIRDELTAILGNSDRLDRLQKDGRFVEELW